MAKITFEDKVALNPQPSVAEKNKCTDANINEIKNSVNALYDAMFEEKSITNCNLYRIGSMVFAVIYSAGTAITNGTVVSLPNGYKISGTVRTFVRYYDGSSYVNGMLIGQNDTISVNNEFGNVPASASFIRALMFWKEQ